MTFKKGDIPWNKGVPHSEETKKKISKANKGHKPPKSAFKKGSQINLGRKRTPEQKEKYRLINLGRKHTQETKNKMSLAKSGRIPSNLKLMQKKRNELAKMGMGRIWSRNNHFTDYAKQRFKEVRKNLIFPKKDSKIELKIQNFLKQLGIECFTHQYINIEHGYQCDILIPSMNMVIECDGDYWHKYPVGNEIDHIRTKELLEKGFKVLRLWEFEIKDMNVDRFKDRINEQG